VSAKALGHRVDADRAGYLEDVLWWQVRRVDATRVAKICSNLSGKLLDYYCANADTESIRSFFLKGTPSGGGVSRLVRAPFTFKQFQLLKDCEVLKFF
jgi:hypothetical protein